MDQCRFFRANWILITSYQITHILESMLVPIYRLTYTPFFAMMPQMCLSKTVDVYNDINELKQLTTLQNH